MVRSPEGAGWSGALQRRVEGDRHRARHGAVRRRSPAPRERSGAEAPRQVVDAAPAWRNRWRSRSKAAAPRRARRSGSRASRLMRVRQRLPIARRRRARPRMPSRMNSGMPAKSRRDDREPLARRLHAARSAGRPGRRRRRALRGQHEESASRSSAITSGCGLGRRGRRTVPAMPARFGLAPSAASQQLAAADMGEAPMQVGRQARRAPARRSSKPFFATARPTRRCGPDRPDRSRRAAGRRSGGGGKAREVEAVIDERHAVRVRRERAADARAPSRRAGHAPQARRRSSRASPSPASSRCPWHGPRRSRCAR